LQRTARESKQQRTEKLKRTQMRKMTRKRRVLAMISSRHGIRDLPCKFPK